jgi:formylglycine-generating enzyme required for sulfatase activity
MRRRVNAFLKADFAEPGAAAVGGRDLVFHDATVQRAAAAAELARSPALFSMFRCLPERSLPMLSHRVLVASCLVVIALTANPALAQPAKPKDGPVGMKLVPLPKATFYMGGGGGKAGKKTEIQSDFEIAIHTVTQGQWQEVMGKNPSYFCRDGGGKAKVKDFRDEDLKHFPVEQVSCTTRRSSSRS